jgi:hypothetical protein
MAHNSKASGSLGGLRDNAYRPRSLRLGKAHVRPAGLEGAVMLKISPAGYLVQPLPEGTQRTAYIHWRHSELTPKVRVDPDWAADSPL